MQLLSNKLREEGRKIGFVPTMGYLHAGHLSLVDKSKKLADATVVSIFVNPKQFAPNEDFNKYPRNLQQDEKLLVDAEVEYLFYPDAGEVYPSSFQTHVDAVELSAKLEGEFRPTHFKGVTTIVTILFNAVKPHYAFFGQKDAQQAAIIKRMVTDLKLDLNIIVCPIVREKDGLAMSSRNVYLSPVERHEALVLHKSLLKAEELINGGEKNSEEIIAEMKKIIAAAKSSNLDYVRIVSAADFSETTKLISGKEYYVLIACRIGSTRLIDNLLIKA